MDPTRSRDGSRDDLVLFDRLLHDLQILTVKPAGDIVADELRRSFAICVGHLFNSEKPLPRAGTHRGHRPFQRTLGNERRSGPSRNLKD
jgi:hypothetical protein